MTDGGDSALGSYDHDSHINDNQSIYDSPELDNLEGRIKRWHLEVGCKKACVTKLNRIDIDVRCILFFLEGYEYTYCKTSIGNTVQGIAQYWPLEYGRNILWKF